MPRLILSLLILFGVTYFGLRWLEEREALSTERLDQLLSEPHAPTPQVKSVFVTRANSPIIEARRARAKQGVQEYLDWHYSVSGSLSEQAEMIAGLYQSVRDSLSGEALNSERLAETARLSALTHAQLDAHIFKHLTVWSEGELEALVREVRGDRVFVVKLFNQKLTRSAIERLRAHEAPRRRPKVGVQSELKLGVSVSFALALTTVSRRIIERVSRFLSYRLARRAMITTMYRGGVVIAGAEGAGSGAVGCAAGGFLGSAGCAIVGMIGGVLLSEWALNEADEAWSRPELERALNDQIDVIFDDFEREVTRSLSSHARDLFRGEDQPREVRVIDLFE